MTEKVVALPNSSADFDVNEDAVERLEFLLEEARAGRLKLLSYACINSDGSTSYGYSKGGNLLGLVGAASQLSWVLCRAFEEGTP